MSELSAFLADHDLEELEDILHDNGMERIMDLSGMDQSNIEALGCPANAAKALIYALSHVSTYAPPSGFVPPPEPNAAFAWTPSPGQQLAAATAEPLPTVPQLPPQQAAAPPQQQQQQQQQQQPPTLQWRRSVQGMWEEAPDEAHAPASMHGWEEIATDDGTYYYHAATGTSTWERPAELGEKWVAHLTDDGKRFFCNATTGETSWDPPASWQSAAAGLSMQMQAVNISDDGGGGTEGAPAEVLPARFVVGSSPPTENARSERSSVVQLPMAGVGSSGGAANPPPPPAAPPPFVWRRSNGELQSAQAEEVDRTLTVIVARNSHGLGLSFNDANEIVSIDPRGGAAASGGLCVGDQALSIDGLVLGPTRPIREVVSQLPRDQPTATLQVHRRAPGSSSSSSSLRSKAARQTKEADEAAANGGGKGGGSKGGGRKDGGSKSRKEGKGTANAPQLIELELVVTRTDGRSPLGVSLDDENVVVGFSKHSVCKTVLHVGDRVLAVDGHELRGRRFATLIVPQPSHTLKVMRVDKQAAARHGWGHGWFGFGGHHQQQQQQQQQQKHRAKHHHAHEDEAFGLSAAAAPDWFGHAGENLKEWH